MKRTSSVWVSGLLLSGWLLCCLAEPAMAGELRGRQGTRTIKRTAAQMPDDLPPPANDLPNPPAQAAPPARRATGPAMEAPGTMPRKFAPPTSYEWEDEVVSARHGAVHPTLDEYCDGDCDGCPKHRGHNRTWWASADYLLWWRREYGTPTLLTTSTNPNSTAVIPGSADDPNRVVLLGNDSFDSQMRAGGRFDFGVWCDPCQKLGFGTRFTGLANNNFDYTVSSATNSLISIPFFNLNGLNNDDVFNVADPVLGTTGTVTVSGHNELYFGDVYLKHLLVKERSYRMEFIGGYFYSHMEDDLIINATNLGGGLLVRDNFRTKNQFNGGTLGLNGNFDRGNMKVNLLAKVALGQMEETVDISGSSTNSANTGLFVQDSNRGVRSRNVFSAVPEFGMNMAYKLGHGIEFNSGYSMIYFDKVVRGGDQIDTGLFVPTNPGDPQTIARPAFNFHESSYWAHGFNFGVTVTY